MPLAALLPAIATAGAGLVDTITNIFQNKKSRASNMELAKYQYKKDLEMWNRNNLYNSPEQQMERLKAAGLNPNMVYGSGSAAGNASTSTAPKFNAPNLQFGLPNPAQGLPSMIAAYQEMQIKKQQLNNLKATEDATRQKTILDAFATKLSAVKASGAQDLLNFKTLQEENKWRMGNRKLTEQDLKNQLLSEGMNYQLSYMKGRNSVQEAQISKMMQDTKYKELQADWYVTNMIAKFGLEAVRTFGSIFPAKKGVDILSKGLGSFNRKTQQRNSERAFNETSRRLQNFGQ